MEIFPAQARAGVPGPADWFTGAATVETLFQADAPDGVAGSNVIFAPGARTVWHSHPRGQILIVIAGRGRAQSAGGPVRALCAGDVVRFCPGERHWHGAAPDSHMVQMAIQQAEKGALVTWADPVTEDDYAAAPATANQ